MSTLLNILGSNVNSLLRASDIVNDGVYDHAGRRLGEIEDMMFDSKSGCVRYVVVSMGGFLGFRRKRYAVPWSALTPHPDLRRSVLDVAKMRMTARLLSDDGELTVLPNRTATAAF